MKHIIAHYVVGIYVTVGGNVLLCCSHQQYSYLSTCARFSPSSSSPTFGWSS